MYRLSRVRLGVLELLIRSGKWSTRLKDLINLQSKRQSVLLEIIDNTKILNTQKATLEKIQKNAEIMNMIDAFGLRIDTKSMKFTYDKDDLRYGKIIIMSDADVDGQVWADERLFA